MSIAALRLRRYLPMPSRLAHRLLFALEVRRQRQHLCTLDAALLADIGITRERATTEAKRPFWDAPGHWSL